MATTSRPSYVAAIYLVACCTIAFAAEPPAKDDKSKPPTAKPPTAKPPIIESITKETADSPAAAAEIKKLVGSWRLVEQVRNGAKRESREKLVVTPTRICLSERGEILVWFQFRLDPTKSPKHLDLQFAVADWDSRDAEASKTVGELMPLIYELDGDTFRFCYGGVDPSEEKKTFRRPDAFVSVAGTHGEVRVHKRCPDIATFTWKTDKDVDGEILKAIDGWIALLEAKEYHKFSDSAREVKYEKREIDDHEVELYKQILAQLRAARRLVPTMSDNGAQADFDLTVCHIPGVDIWVVPTFQLVRKDGKAWKLEGL